MGISGPTAAVVGRLLRQLGESTQVMVVTHLPQVAGKGHQHMVVSKHTDGKTTETQMQALDQGARLNELARLLGRPDHRQYPGQRPRTAGLLRQSQPSARGAHGEDQVPRVTQPW